MASSPPFVSTRREREHDVCTIGTALIDYLTHASHESVQALDVEPGAMTLIDGPTAARIRAALGEGERVVSGGTVGNTAAGVASLGGSPVFVGAVADDDLGRHFASDLRAAGVEPVLEQLPIGSDGATGTGTCYVMVTPDHHRTMATTLGVSGLLGHQMITEAIIASASLVYFDGYLLDFPDADAIVGRILELAHVLGTTVALGLADPFVVERHHERLGSLVGQVDLVFSNADEVTALTGASSVAEAIESLRSERAIVVTCGAEGAYLANAHGVVHVDAVSVPELVDTTGAGDLFAAGVVYGVTRGLGAEQCGRLGALCAAEVISHLGARPVTPLSELTEREFLLG